MKKITFLFAMLFIATMNFAQTVLYTQDFEGATRPSGWTDQNVGVESYEWSFGSGVVPGSVADFPTNAAIFDDDTAGNSGNQNARVLWYGPINVSDYINVTLNYEYALNVLSAGTEELTVRLWDNENTAWITIVTYSEDTDPTADSIDVSAAILANPGIDPSTLYFGFGYDDLDGDWAWGAGIDNVELTGAEFVETIFTHVATADNSIANYTIIDHPLLNGNPNAIIKVSHNWQEAGVLNENTVGVWYNGSNWTIFDETSGNVIPNGAAFNVYIAGTDSNAYIHTATGSFSDTAIDNALVNGDPNAIIVLGNNLVSPGYVYTADHYGLWFDGTNWNIYNEDGNVIPTDAAFNVILAPTDNTVKAIQHQATAANTTDYWTVLDDPLLNGYPDAKFVFTHNWGSIGDVSNVLVANTQSVWYDTASGTWRIFNDDISDMPTNVKFNILVLNNNPASVDDVETLSFNIFPNPVKDVLNVQSQDTISKIAIYNIMGQEVRVLTPNTSGLEVNLNGLDAGVYIIKVVSNNKEMSKKFIKK